MDGKLAQAQRGNVALWSSDFLRCRFCAAVENRRTAPSSGLRRGRQPRLGPRLFSRS